MCNTTISETQRQHPFCLVQFASDAALAYRPVLLMQTTGAQYIFQLHHFRSDISMQAAIDRLDPADRLNACHVPGQWAFLMTAGNMQQIPMQRLNPDDVYRDIQECKEDCARWVEENWALLCQFCPDLLKK